MRRKSVVLSLIVVLLVAAGGWWWKSRSAAHDGGAAAATPAARGASGPGGTQMVGVVTAQRRDVPVTVEASGTVTPLNQVDVRAQTTSTVRDVLVHDGQTVAKGQPLFRFDDRADRANLDKARAQLARDKASLGDLQRQYERAKDLLAQKFVAQSAVDTALANLEGGRSLVDADAAAVQSATVALSYNEIRAPFAGRAGAVNVWPGSLVQASASGTPLVNIVQIDPIAISFNLPETELAPVLDAMRPQGGAARPAPEVQVVLPTIEGGPSRKDSRSGKPVESVARGKLIFVDNLVDATTGTIKLKAEFENAAQKLWPGQYLRVRMTLRSMPDAIVIPQAAIILRGSDRQVYVVGPDKTAQLKPVKLRYTFGEMAVVDGVDAGATVVLDGKQNLRPGTPVRTQPAAVNPAAAARLAAAASAAGAGASNGDVAAP
ncbi:efflux RND transporter periplasmic adaptor subunit [Mitsuaria sp. GD03876]|uniref:efflux RND transporter periplasmic adaptor subunit n=1 Tax=Mitsuaria sp. GD03876 TaxID=2975399 RepID=UPI002449413C|nr:efflux RND transporter periplasmic adaptor subunit [Mitsuaria sp. GD03876]MDH0864871.1 efflux RND transporter periplasmic adaptor subunit [Mitsuaria sp. GD03876]